MADNSLFAWVRRVQKEQTALIKLYEDRLIDYFQNKVLKRLAPKNNALVLRIKAEPELTANQIQRTDEYKDLLKTTQEELDEFAEYATQQIDLSSTASITAGVAAFIALANILNIEQPAVVTPTAVELLASYLKTDGELLGRIDLWSNFHTDKVKDMILEGVRLGRNPVKIGKSISEAIGGALTDSVRTTRTVQLWSYREATRANYIANSDIIKGWIWYASLDLRTCLSCVNMHGSVHPLSEPLNDHHNGRCDMLPFPQGLDALNETGFPTGEEWFNAQSDEFQEKSMGKEKYEAWKNGKFTFDQLTQEYTDPVYGAMRNEASLKSIL